MKKQNIKDESLFFASAMIGLREYGLYSDLEIEGLKFIKLNRKVWDKYFDEFWAMLGDLDLDYCDKIDSDKFEIIPFHITEQILEHEEDIETYRPVKAYNFYYKPLDFKIIWHKHPFRDSYCNKKITFYKMMEMIEDCCKFVLNAKVQDEK